MAHDPNCGCWILVDSPAAKRGIETADRETRAGRDAGRYVPRDETRP